MSGSNNDPSVSGEQSYSAGLFLGEPPPPQFFHSPPPPADPLCQVAPGRSVEISKPWAGKSSTQRRKHSQEGRGGCTEIALVTPLVQP